MRSLHAVVAVVTVCFISCYGASAIVAPIKQCELHTNGNTSKCSASPLLISALPAPEALTEKLLVHFAALSYACGLHATAAACAKDSQHSCVFGREGAGGDKCRVSPLALMQHSAEALLCADSEARTYIGCSMVANCTATEGCTAVRSGGCIPSWKVGMSEEEAFKWNKAYLKGKESKWGVCHGAVVFRQMQSGCVADTEAECKKEMQCGWTQVGEGRAPLCTPVLAKVEGVLESRAGGAFQTQYKEARKLCRALLPSKCNTSESFTPNAPALLAYSDLSTVTAGTNTTTPTKHRHHHHDHPATPAAPATPPTTPSEAPLTPPTIHHPHPHPHRHPGPPSAASIAVLVLASILCVAVIGLGSYSLYQRMRTPQMKYEPVDSDFVDVQSSKGHPAVEGVQMGKHRAPAP